ncbi:DUF3737 family protein [Breoghania sp.]|uniref:DUF3737 family protein n=1 Tax=Breoghania sp. TaxID=2065378 RepID=UPI002AA85520|nr:DUF3737 family protein [Breoghania sp.]
MTVESRHDMTKTATVQSTISHRFFEGERPLFKISDTTLESVRFYPGESALKHTRDVLARNCEFMGKYPFWHADRITLEDCLFTVYARAAIWYTQNLVMRDCVIEAPKMFRRVSHLTIEDTRFPNAGETLWNCRDVTLRNVELKGADYVFMNGEDIEIENMKLQGNYSFQTARNVVIRNSELHSKDAFWEAENVTVYDSVLEGEYLGWHSRNLRLVNCTIRGEQPLCYATDLVMENCRMEGTDLAFEYSTLNAEIVSDIVSVKNPSGGVIRARDIGEVIIDENADGACQILTEAVPAV